MERAVKWPSGSAGDSVRGEQVHDEGEAVFGDVQAGDRNEEHGALCRRGRGRRPVVGMVYIDKYELPKPFPEKIRVTIELAE
jgi:hypothetical protein